MIEILIVEDEKPISDLIRLNLMKAGYSCTCAFDGMEAADILEERNFDLIILDVMLPKLNGFELMEYIKPLGIPVIFLTAKATLDDRLRGLTSGAEDYMVKPFEIVELLARVNIVLNPISIGGSAVSIRKFPEHPMSMERLVEIEALSPEVARLLQILTQAKYNIFISGGTGSGKTTFLNALSQYIPDDERIITIEDSAELQLLGAKNIVRLETRNANTDGVTPITIRALIMTALRMRPDRIIVGECRGAEALDMLQAMNTGHDGSLSTGHANSPQDIISRIETMVLQGQDFPLNAIRQQIASGIDIIVQLGRLRDKSRRVLEVSEVDGFMDGEIVLHTLYRFEETGVLDSGRIQGFLKKAGTLCHTDKLMAAGLSV